jgi:hypothetical protein
MKKFYILFFVSATLGLSAQTTINYPQQTANYSNFFTDNGGNYDNGADELGMWANGGGAKQSVAWRNFTENGSTSGTPSTMAIGDSFTITISATQASFGVIGLALLSSPTSSSTWTDRINNYAVQVNLNGNAGANDPWEVVSTGGTVDASAVGGSEIRADFKFTFTLNSASTMTVSINDGVETFNITLNNTDITGYCVYFNDDWNGSANENIFLKQTTEYTYATTLTNNSFEFKDKFSVFPNPANNTIKIGTAINALTIYNINGKLIQEFKGEFGANSIFNISNLNPNIYILKATNKTGKQQITKLVKY